MDFSPKFFLYIWFYYVLSSNLYSVHDVKHDLKMSCYCGHTTWAIMLSRGFPGGSDGKESTCNAGDSGLMPGTGRTPGERNGYPLQYSCLENSMDKGAWQATVHGVINSQTRLRDYTFTSLS